ncbi:hypothetical protein RND71_039591 [Anisodus tanguticus]|uniref:Uncharacterized protein n=1 Tax=Anisodus tanguticus TaxID=243964 RepID=A0AAE1QWS4_9SOLA|nr:hypothetical protein RND71_039591 [Anisodus tanguticus]
MGDLDLALRLGPPSPTKEALEREVSTFLSSFGNREVRRDVLEGTIRKLDLNNASPEKLFLRIRQLIHIFDLAATEIDYQIRSHGNAKLRDDGQDLYHRKEKIVSDKDGLKTKRKTREFS